MKFSFLRKGVPAVSEVSTLRLYLLRGMYLYMFVGLAIYKWPGIINPPPGLLNEGSVVGSVLGAFSLLALLGIRYPVKMLPLLFIELLWKSMWFLGWGLPLAFSDQLSPAAIETLTGCIMGIVLVPLATPWGYVFKHYVKAPGDRWGKQLKVTENSPNQPSSSPYEAATISLP